MKFEFIIHLYNSTTGTKTHRTCISTYCSLEQNRKWLIYGTNWCLTRIRKPVRIFVLNPVFARNKNIILCRLVSINLPPGKHHVHKHSLVRACNLHIKHGKHQWAKQPKNKGKSFYHFFFFIIQVPRSLQQPHIPVLHSFSNAQTFPVGCVRIVLKKRIVLKIINQGWSYTIDNIKCLKNFQSKFERISVV